jgi:hypothetical protein
MHIMRDEFLLLSRTGRMPPGHPRAGPAQHRHELPPTEPWVLQTALAVLAGMLRHRRDGGAVGQAPDAVGQAPAPGAGYADPETYLQLEFAVGFATEDEPSLPASQ